MTDENETILDIVRNDENQCLTLIKDEYGAYRFKAGIAPAAGDEKTGWTYRWFNKLSEATEWLDNTFKARARAQRRQVSYPVTLRVKTRFAGGPVRFGHGILRGVDVRDGTWKVTFGLTDKKGSVVAENIFKRMPDDVAEKVSALATEINQKEYELRKILKQFDLTLPYIRHGRVTVDQAIEADEKLVKLFEQDH